MARQSIRRRWRWLAVITGVLAVIVLVWLGRPVLHLVFTAVRDAASRPSTPPPGYLDDASRLNRTRIAEVWSMPAGVSDVETELAALLAHARAEGRRVSIAGARHTMGGHTLYSGGLVINMLPWNQMELDEKRDVLKVQAGALWRDVIRYLDARGRSVAVMQSNNSFTVGGSISVNCHGWQHGWPPIASTVESFRIMLADGRVLRCSRQENAELFSLALGGYGLFGVILDVELRVVPNRRYRLEQRVLPLKEALELFEEGLRNRPGLEMVYARMSIVPGHLFEGVIINAFYHDPNGEIPALGAPWAPRLRRLVFRGSERSAYGKKLRWSLETRVEPLLRGKIFSRNQLLNEGVEVFQNRSEDTTDILHEYFVPHRHALAFIQDVRRIVEEHGADLLNVTVRDVREDKDTFLRYATEDMVAFVMLFLQERTEEGERAMASLTRDLIDAALAHEGRYYLPYRLHATREQFLRAYPQATEFFRLKRKYDPEELFQNMFYLKYGRAQVGG